MNILLRLCALVLLAMTGCQAAPDDGVATRFGDIEIVAPWVRATVPGAPAAGGFLTIRNTGRSADRLTGVSTSAAAESQIHEMSMDNGVMRMRQLMSGLEIPPGASVELKPGSYHLMLINPKTQFTQGQSVPMRLTFARAGNVDVVFPVRPLESGTDEHGHAH